MPELIAYLEMLHYYYYYQDLDSFTRPYFFANISNQLFSKFFQLLQIDTSQTLNSYISLI